MSIELAKLNNVFLAFYFLSSFIINRTNSLCIYLSSLSFISDANDIPYIYLTLFSSKSSILFIIKYNQIKNNSKIFNAKVIYFLLYLKRRYTLNT